jgi:N-acetylglucosamine kinase-like BadF-type ATPase
MTQLVLGVDGGATKTQVVIMDDAGSVLGVGEGGPSNYTTVGLALTQAHIAAAVAAARRAAGLAVQPFAAAFFGMASVVSPLDRARIHTIATHLELAATECIGVDHDCRIALAGGLSGRPGIVQIAGTGSSTFGINAQGEQWRSGGWGHLIADEGSGYWLGLQAMQAAVRAYDGRLGPTVLEARVMEFLQLAEMNDIYQPLYVTPLEKHEVARLAPLVLEAAAGGDAVALQLLQEGTAQMAACVDAVARRLGMGEGVVEIAVTGGLFRAGALVTQPFAAAIAGYLSDFRLVPAELSPVLGAGLLALEFLGVRLPTSALARLAGAQVA